MGVVSRGKGCGVITLNKSLENNGRRGSKRGTPASASSC